MSRRVLPRAIALAGGALLLATSGALAGTPAPATVRTSPSGFVPRVLDLSARGASLLAAWDETGGAGAAGGLASTESGGSPFSEWMAVAGWGPARTDACPAPLYRIAVLGFTNLAGDRAIQLATGAKGRIMEQAGTDFRRADITCIGAAQAVLAVVWQRPAPAGTHLILWRFKPDLTDGPAGYDLGRVKPSTAPVLVARGPWLHVAWISGTALKYTRFRIGGGSTPSLAPRPTVTIETGSGQSAPQLGADGKRVVLAWQRKGSVVARVSTDGGASFGARRSVLAGSPATGKVAFLDSADVLGSAIIVAGTVVSEGISATGKVLRTKNAGATWKAVPGASRSGGFLFAALGGSAAAPVLHLAWDERFTGNDPASIRAAAAPLP